MIDVISGEEPPVEMDEEPSRSFGAPHAGWFLATVVLQLVILLFIGASKLHAMPPAKIVNVEALTGGFAHDKFRGYYVSDVIFNADAASILPIKPAKEVVLIFDTNKHDKRASALSASAENWKFVRIDSASNGGGNKLRPSEVALKAKVSPSRFHSGKQMIFINTSPFFIGEDAADFLSLCLSSRTPAEFKLAVDKDGNASILSVDTTHWLSADRSH